MTKESSSHSSAVGSPHLLPFSNERENRNDVIPVEAQPAAAPPRDPKDGSSSSNPAQTATITTSDVPTVESQPMTATNSNASNPPAKDSQVNNAGPAVPYGTRSRNRTGTSRPNYAEDNALDAEFEIGPPAKDNAGRKPGRVIETASSNIDVGKPASSGQKAPKPEAEQILPVHNHHKEPIPGTSTFSANPAASVPHQTSKKRKAVSQTAVATSQQGSAQASSGQTTTRKASMAAQVAAGFRETNMLTFENCAGQLKDSKLIADDGTILQVNDHAYLVCEPPGEPYYLGRIMEFLHANNDNTQPIDAVRINWYYRPKDIGRKVNDTRQVFASMHSDVSPLTAFRGKCEIKHKSEVEQLDVLRRTKDCFWYEKLYDRYIHRYYDVIPTSQVINVPTEVKKVLDERWKYIIVEPGRGKELTSAVKSCKRCNKYCATNDSVDCAVCRNTYHMSCVSPPLLKKPSRGFAWACGPCSKAQEKRLEARNTPNIAGREGEYEDAVDEEDGSPGTVEEAFDTAGTSPADSNVGESSLHPGTAEQIHQASLWLFRYLGIHCKVEDALDYDDRIYPRASSRLGPRHQANVPVWPGRQVEYVKSADIKKRYVKGANGHKKEAKFSKDTVAALEAEKLAREKRPKWVMDEPPGYVHRGDDYDNDDPNNTAQLLYKLPEANEIIIPPGVFPSNQDPKQLDEATRQGIIFSYVCRAKDVAQPLYDLPVLSTNVLDIALQTLRTNGYDIEKALGAMSHLDKKIFKEPRLSPAELKKFEDGVSKFGSEWHTIKKHVKSMSSADVVRFYYTWKKTAKGKQVWGSYSGRKGKKEAKRAEASVGKLQDDVADEYDDSAFDNDKAFEKKRGFQCKFCCTRSSRQWRRAPNTPAGTMVVETQGAKPSAKDKGSQVMVALCRRCAELWRRYAIQWEDVDEVSKKVAQAGGRSWKRKIDEELVKELIAANEVTNRTADPKPVAPVSSGSTPTPAPSNVPAITEPPRKKLKASAQEKELVEPVPDAVPVQPTTQKKKILPEKPPPPPPPPEPPKPKLLPCAICNEMDPTGDQHLSCKECRLTVHRHCYGVVGEGRSPSKWTCDMCSNDKNPQVSIQYKCMLCPVEQTEHDFVEPPKISHKKKTEKEREKDRVEREIAQKVANYFRKKQEELNKPVNPREPLKRTANNNWVHVTCAVFTPEVKFGNAKALEPSEGIPSIASARYDETCKACKQKGGACVGCYSCRAPVHVGCAHQAGYLLGFDIAPVKGSRREQFNIVNINGEVGTMTAAIWCKEHIPTKTIVHRMHDIVDETGLNALQLYVQNFKQADLALTGTVRKATLVNQSTKAANPTTTPNRRASTTANTNGNSVVSRALASQNKADDTSGDASLSSNADAEKTCATCNVDISPKWWPFPSTVSYSEPATRANGDHVDTNGLGDTEHQASQDYNEEDSGRHAALAAAALHQNTQPPEQMVVEFQCHKCHWKKIQREPSPPPLPPPPPPPPPLQVIRQEDSRPPPISIPSTLNGPAPESDIGRTVSQYTWPPPPAYPGNGHYNTWNRNPPVTQGVPHGSQLNGNHSPQVPTPVQPLSVQTQMRPSIPSIPHSPHQNGHMGQIPNGYPSSPHRNMGPSSLHTQNGTYASYASTRPPSHHLTNGGLPPRVPESSWSHSNAPVHSRSSFGQPPQGSPPMLFRETHPQADDNNHPQPPSVRQNDGRVNGGASASPSLRNLLS